MICRYRGPLVVTPAFCNATAQSAADVAQTTLVMPGSLLTTLSQLQTPFAGNAQLCETTDAQSAADTAPDHW
jgi:hypothetical protein